MRNLLRDVEPAEASRGVCLNRFPTVRFLGPRNGPQGAPPDVVATVGDELKLFGSVGDKGLPRAGTLVTRWRMLGGPGTVTFSAPDEPRTLAWPRSTPRVPTSSSCGRATGNVKARAGWP